MLKNFLFVCASILFATSPLTMTGLTPQEAAPVPAPVQVAANVTNPVKPTAESQAKAKRLYGQDCAMCHGDNGNGKTEIVSDMKLSVPDWSNAKTSAAKSDADMFNAIRNGKDKMPPEAEGRAKDDDVWNLVIYLRSFSK